MFPQLFRVLPNFHGICSGTLNSIFEGDGSGKADGTLYLKMTEGATEPTSASLAIMTGIPGLLLVASGSG